MTRKHIDPQQLYEWLQRFNWKNPDHALLVLGWLQIAPLCGALPRRPHLYVTGPKNTGKSTLHEGVAGALEPLVITCDADTSEAGVRQKLGYDAKATVMDEFEVDNATQMEKIIRLARSAYAANAKRLRGTQEGAAIEYNITTCFFFAGINPPILAPADSSRIVVVELQKHDGDKEQRKAILEYRDMLRQENDWALNAVKSAQAILNTIKVFELHISDKVERVEENMAALLGGAYFALHSSVPDKKVVKDWGKQHWSLLEEHGEQHERNEPEECLAHLLAHQFDRRTLENYLQEYLQQQDVQINEALLAHGIKVEHGEIYIAYTHPALHRIFRDTRYTNGAWQKPLMNIQGSRKERKYFLGSQMHCIAMPVDQIKISKRPIIEDSIPM